MALILHKTLADGSFTHEEFTCEAWDDAVSDPDVAVPMGHPEDGCPGIEALKWAVFFSWRRSQGFALNAAQSELADDGDGLWFVRKVKPEKTPEIVPPPAGANWPPTNELTPKLLASMTGRCETDCDEILNPNRKHVDLSEPVHMLDKKGQWSLF